MSTSSEPKIHEVAAALTRLRGDTLSSLSLATDVRTANLSVWLRGREQVISEKRIVAVMHHLGLKGNSLRYDVIHKWTVSGSIKDIQTVFEFCLSSTQKQQTLILQGNEIGLTSHHILRIPHGENVAYIVVTLEPTPNEVPVLTPESLKFGAFIKCEHSFRVLPSKDEELKQAVTFYCDEAIFHLTESAEGTEIAKIFESISLDQTSTALLDPHDEDFSKLKAELSRILGSGVSPDELALKLSMLY